MIELEVQILYAKSKFIIISKGSAGEAYRFVSKSSFNSILSASIDLHISIDEVQKLIIEGEAKKRTSELNNKNKDKIKVLGKRLFDLIFINETFDLLNICVGKSLKFNSEVNIKLVLGEEYLNIIPWEILYDGKSFLSHIYNIYRQPFSLFPVRKKNSQNANGNILFVGADPQQNLGISESLSVIQAVFKSDKFPGKEIISPNATYENIANEIFDGVEFLHFMAHGEYNEESNGFNFIVDNPNPDLKIQMLPLNMLSSFCKGTYIQLVLLDSCRSDQPFDYKKVDKKKLIGISYKSMAMELLRTGIPCVIGVSHPISKIGSKIFTKRIYRSLVERNETANKTIRQIRLELYAYQDRIPISDWFTPILYSRVDNYSIKP